METKEQDQEQIRAKAREKLEAELKAEKNRIYAEPIILHMIKRCEEDAGLAEDVLQEQKTFKRCFDYIYVEAKKQADGSRMAYVVDSVVYEWAEDYYRMDDKAVEKKKAEEAKSGKTAAGKASSPKKAAEPAQKKQTEESAEVPKPAEKKQAAVAEKTAEPAREKAEKPAESPKQEKAKQKKPKQGREMDGQMDLFSILGMQEAADAE